MDCYRSLIAFVLVVGPLVASLPAHTWASDAPSPAALNEARERFAEGRKLEEARKFDEALVMFQHVARVKTTPQVRFHIALCLMHTGKRINALDEFHTAIAEAGSSAPNVVVEAQQHIATLEKQVAGVTVNVPAGEAEGSVISFDGRVVTANVQFYAEPGSHRVTLVHAGQTTTERTVTVSAGERVQIALTDTAEPTNARRVGSIIAFSVAGASALSVGVFALLRADRLARVEAACPTYTGCDRSLEPVVREGKTYSAVINVLGGFAVAAAVTGGVLYATSLSPSPPRSTKNVELRMHPVVGPGIGFVELEAKF